MYRGAPRPGILIGCVLTLIAAISWTAAAPPDAADLESVVLAQAAAQNPTGTTGADPNQAAERARATEAKMTDDERFSLIISLIGAVPSIGVPRDPRIPTSVTNMSAGESKTVTVKADPRLLARFDAKNGLGQWRITEGTYRIALGTSAGEPVLTADAPLNARVFGK